MEYGGIVIEVERELCPVEIRILSYGRVVIQCGSLTESIHRSHLVLGLDEAVAEMVICDLTDRVTLVTHHRVCVDGPPVVLYRIKHRTVEKPVGP